jgi:hypothetical protein
MLIERHRKEADDRDAQQDAGSDLAVHECGCGCSIQGCSARHHQGALSTEGGTYLNEVDEAPRDSWTLDYELNATADVLLKVSVSARARSGLFRRVDLQTEKTGQGIGRNPKKSVRHMCGWRQLVLTGSNTNGKRSGGARLVEGRRSPKRLLPATYVPTEMARSLLAISCFRPPWMPLSLNGFTAKMNSVDSRFRPESVDS